MPGSKNSRTQIIAVNIDEATDRDAARKAVERELFFFPAVFATEDVAGVYNIIYRYLFDRRRDLGVPTCFLLDREGMLVKVYQGPASADRILEDVRTAPTAAERSDRALPFKGKLFQGSFQRNAFTYGVAMFQHGYLEQAASSFQEVIAARPDDPEAYYNLGTLNLRTNNLTGGAALPRADCEATPQLPGGLE